MQGEVLATTHGPPPSGGLQQFYLQWIVRRRQVWCSYWFVVTDLMEIGLVGKFETVEMVQQRKVSWSLDLRRYYLVVVEEEQHEGWKMVVVG